MRIKIEPGNGRAPPSGRAGLVALLIMTLLLAVLLRTLHLQVQRK